ncbi:MAG TPA: rod shape-determining protein MreC [Geminicoccaceae bacterium]|nr:rod shape-determining protein MreC [Geminicoccaceae bacterium]
MRLERRSLSRLALPLKALADRFAFGALVALSLALLVVGRANVELLRGLGTRIGDALTPALVAVMQPVDATRRVIDDVGELVALRAENARLREQNRRLMEWQSAARQLSLENAALRQLLGMPDRPERPTAVAGRVIADTGGPFVHTVLLDVGAEHGVARGMAAVNERGLAGRVIEVGRRSARVLLLTDFNSRIPVMVEPSRDQAILAGNNTGLPTLAFLPLDPRLAVGDRVVTSGRGGVLPPGIEVGTVRRIDDDGVVVEPLVDFARLEYLRLLEYTEIVPPEQLEQLQREMYGPPLPPGFVPPEPPAAAEVIGLATTPAAEAAP